jgi:hypothetical protein
VIEARVVVVVGIVIHDAACDEDVAGGIIGDRSRV